MQKVIATISLENIRENARLFKTLSQSKLCAVVKANAYGHGSQAVALALSEIADCFAVALLDEGLAIRTAACGKDILVFTPPTTKEHAYHLAANGFLATLPDLHTARLFASVCREYGLQGRAHLKVNTGMNRYGMNDSMLGKVCRFLKGTPVRVEGVYSHLYACNTQIAEEQRGRFLALERLARRYYPHLCAHFSATYGASLGAPFAFDMVRVGLGLYGYFPTPTTLPLRRAMQVYAEVVACRNYRYGGAGYGALTLPKGTPLSVYRAGYADGFLRRKENGTNGEARNVNNLCMDVCLRAEREKRGSFQPLLLDADETARATGTISYEVLCAATRRAEFVYE